jgi:hypothetical protein
VGYHECFHWLYRLWKAEKIGNFKDTAPLSPNNRVRQEMLTFLETSFPDQFKDLTADIIVYDWQGV